MALDYFVPGDKNDMTATAERCYFRYVEFCPCDSCLQCPHYEEHKQERCERRGFVCQ